MRNEPARMSADDVKPCAWCGKQASHNIIFYIVRVEQAMVDPQAVQRQAGLEMMLGGNATIAAAMGDRDVIRKWPYGTGEAQVCGDCLIEPTLGTLMVAMEVQDEPEEAEATDDAR